MPSDKSLSKHVQDVIDENWARCQHTPERTAQLEALRDVRAVLEAVLDGNITERARRILELDGEITHERKAVKS